MRATRKNDRPWLPMTHSFYVKILSYFQNEDVYKKLDQKIFIFERMARNFVWSPFFWVEPRNFFKISYITQFLKFLSELLHVITNYTYQQVINSNLGSNMAPLIVSMGRGPLRPLTLHKVPKMKILWSNCQKLLKYKSAVNFVDFLEKAIRVKTLR